MICGFKSRRASGTWCGCGTFVVSASRTLFLSDRRRLLCSQIHWPFVPHVCRSESLLHFRHIAEELCLLQYW